MVTEGRRWTVLAALGVVVAFLLACAPAPGATPTPGVAPPEAAAGEPRYGGTLIANHRSKAGGPYDVPNWDRDIDCAAGRIAHLNMVNSKLFQYPSGRQYKFGDTSIVGDLAKSWQ